MSTFRENRPYTYIHKKKMPVYLLTGTLFQMLKHTFVIHEHPIKSTPLELYTNSPKNSDLYNLPHIINNTRAIVVGKMRK